MRFLHYAYNNESISIDEWDYYRGSWLDTTFIVEETTESFRIAVNYPTIYSKLMDTFKAHVTNIGEISEFNYNNLLSCGYHFENTICRLYSRTQ